jgi:uncharacterized SAM-binding protein YcdF (DUF218 family)
MCILSLSLSLPCGVAAVTSVPRQSKEGYSLSVADQGRPAFLVAGDRNDDGGHPRKPSAIVVLGCRVRLDSRGRLAAGALARRVATGARAYAADADPGLAPAGGSIVVVSGGRRWGDVVEADAMARELEALGVPAGAIVRERLSFSTRENARFTAEVLARRGVRAAMLVTCPWHMERAVGHFASSGLLVLPVPAAGGQEAAWPSRVWRWGVERVLTRI